MGACPGIVPDRHTSSKTEDITMKTRTNVRAGQTLGGGLGGGAFGGEQ